MKSLLDMQRNWEGLAQADPLWAICTDPQKKNKKWDKDQFFATGRKEIETVMDCLGALGVKVNPQFPALDFGCGVGRLTRAMAPHFSRCYGIDISPTMVRMAAELNRDIPQCRFLVNDKERLAEFEDNYFGFIYTSIVLQHIAEPYSRKYLVELVRVLKPGGALVFQIPDSFRAKAFVRLRTKLGLRSRLPRWFPGKNYVLEMHCISEDAVHELVRHAGARMVDVRLTNSTDPSFSGNLRYLNQEPEWGYVSKQYCVVKPGLGA
jgi:SAM-dependent methyltransferase